MIDRSRFPVPRNKTLYGFSHRGPFADARTFSDIHAAVRRAAIRRAAGRIFSLTVLLWQIVFFREHIESSRPPTHSFGIIDPCFLSCNPATASQHSVLHFVTSEPDRSLASVRAQSSPSAVEALESHVRQIAAPAWLIRSREVGAGLATSNFAYPVADLAGARSASLR